MQGTVLNKMASDVASKMTIKTMVACALLWASIALLYPGITGDLMHYRVNYEIEWLGRTLNVKEEVRSLWGPDKSIIQALYNKQAVWAARFLIFFGCVIPTLKIILFHAWLLTSRTSAAGKLAEKGTHIMGGISRWVAVDAVVEAMFVGMLLKIPSVQCDHRIAFLSFVAYCILSATAFLLVEEEKTPSAGPMKLALGRAVRRTPVLVIASSLVFIAFLYLGATTTVIRVMIPEQVIKEAAWETLKDTQQPTTAVKALEDHLVDEVASKIKIDEEVSVVGCIHRLVLSGVVISAVGSAILFFCVLVVPLADALLGMLSVIRPEHQKMADRVRHILHHFAMLDVMIVGMILAILTSKCEPDIRAGLLPGFLFLVGACFTWYIHSTMCSAASAAAAAPKAKASTDQVEDGLLQEQQI